MAAAVHYPGIVRKSSITLSEPGARPNQVPTRREVFRITTHFDQILRGRNDGAKEEYR
jgi:hypothetical protein